jgi:hypothetical protein
MVRAACGTPPAFGRAVALLGGACAHLVFCLLLSFCGKRCSNLEKAATTLNIRKTGGKKAVSLTRQRQPGKKPCR